MQAIGEIAGRALTATQARQTPEKPVNIEAWAKWAGFEIVGNADEVRQLRALLEACARFCREVKANKPPRWLSLLGLSGAGKTYLAKRIWRWRRYGSPFAATVARGHDGRDEVVYPGQWCYWPDLAGELLSNRGYERVDELKREAFVCIDEIGADRDPNGHVKDCLSRVLCSRVGKWTIVTSNKTLEQVANDIDTRVASRMIRDGSQVVEVDVRDYWLRKNQ